MTFGYAVEKKIVVVVPFHLSLRVVGCHGDVHEGIGGGSHEVVDRRDTRDGVVACV